MLAAMHPDCLRLRRMDEHKPEEAAVRKQGLHGGYRGSREGYIGLDAGMGYLNSKHGNLKRRWKIQHHLGISSRA